ncbi:2,3-bisphosphoglycerate-independent phosphoglycerate mutase [bioreactor metagenome]|uniref:2,3-bisphosphoglycerate-independent phosphoglycerate mutase n=1 Tax=bioreactor metagenome TaxID=1076179 RepID=A0A645GEL5_9ZZZZ
MTYFWNGNRSNKFDGETWQEVPSDVVPFEQRPWMKAAEITDAVVSAIASGKYGMIRLNFANGDMVGHTGVYQSVLVAVETLDICVQRIREAVEAAGGVMVITADHGNSDDMYEHDKKGNVKMEDGRPARKTSHSLNPVPCIVYDPGFKGEYTSELKTGLGISSIPATCMELLGFVPPAEYDSGVLNLK